MSRGHVTRRSIGAMEILVVEDETGVADFLARGLGAEGFEVGVAGDGIDVLTGIRRRKPELPARHRVGARPTLVGATSEGQRTEPQRRDRDADDHQNIGGEGPVEGLGTRRLGQRFERICQRQEP